MGDLAWAACNMSFPDCLERVHSLRILLSDLHYFPEASLSNHLKQIERLDCEGFIAQLFKVDFQMEGAGAIGRCVPLVCGVLQCL